MTSDQELFAKGLATYQKMVAANYYSHKQVYGVLHEVLLNEAKDGFVFADLACGAAPCSAAALAGTGITRYVGIDISKPALKRLDGERQQIIANRESSAYTAKAARGNRQSHLLGRNV